MQLSGSAVHAYGRWAGDAMSDTTTVVSIKCNVCSRVNELAVPEDKLRLYLEADERGQQMRNVSDVFGDYTPEHREMILQYARKHFGWFGYYLCWQKCWEEIMGGGDE